jgi:hypothetical protein
MSKLAYFLGGIATGVIGLTAAALLDDKYGWSAGSRIGYDDKVAEEASGNTSEEDGWDEETATFSADSPDQPESAETASA